MKPPPRKRTKKNDTPTEPEKHPGGLSSWKPREQRKLLSGLKAQAKTEEEQDELDYESLKKDLPARSTEEIKSVIDTLKDKAISSMCGKLENKRRNDNKIRKPIEKWTEMAAVVGGALEKPITTAFSQVLIVSSTEPLTLKSGNPPQMENPPTGQNSPIGRKVPFRPVYHIPVQGQRPGTNALRPLPIFKPSAQTLSPAQRLPTPAQVAASTAPPPKQQSTEAAGTPPLASMTCQTSESVSACTHGCTQTAPQPQTTTAPVPSTSASSPSLPGAASSSAPTHTTATFGPDGKNRANSCLRILGGKFKVDFGKIYQYLGLVHNPDQGCKLSPMESAIVLDLLMSLPEELPQLDCKNLKKHLVQVYHNLSVPADAELVKELFKDLKGAGETERHTAGSQDGPHAHSTGAPQAHPQQDDHSRDTTHPGPKALQPQETDNQSPGNAKPTQSQHVDDDLTGLCPPLNPFMVPPQLLMRKSSAK